MKKSKMLLTGLVPVLAGVILSHSAMAQSGSGARKLSLTVNPTTIPESGGAQAATGTISRTGATTAALTVRLGSTDRSEARVPATVTIPAGSASTSFFITAVPDNRVDETRRLHIVANAPGFTPARVQISVTDATSAALRLAIRPRRISETGGRNAATATLTRNTATPNALTVVLTSSDPTRARVPASVVIPAGKASVTFPVSAVSNRTRARRGYQIVRITASSASMTPAISEVVVMDTPAPAPRR